MLQAGGSAQTQGLLLRIEPGILDPCGLQFPGISTCTVVGIGFSYIFFLGRVELGFKILGFRFIKVLGLRATDPEGLGSLGLSLRVLHPNTALSPLNPKSRNPKP